MAKRYCEMCDKFVSARQVECAACGADTVVVRDEPAEPDGEAFRGGEAAAYEREQMAEWQRLK